MYLQDVQMQPDEATQLQNAITDGNFDEAISLLSELIQNPSTLKQVGFGTERPYITYSGLTRGWTY